MPILLKVIIISQLHISSFEGLKTNNPVESPFTLKQESLLPSSTEKFRYALSLYGKYTPNIFGCHMTEINTSLYYQKWSVDAGLQTYSISQYQEKCIFLSGGFKSKKFILKTTPIFYNRQIRSEQKKENNLYDIQNSFGFKPFNWISFSYIQRGLFSILKITDTNIIFPESLLAISLKPFRGNELSFLITRSADGYITSFYTGLNPGRRLTVLIGYTIQSEALHISTTFLVKQLKIEYGITSHPCFGISHSLGVQIRNYSSNYESIDFHIRKVTGIEIKKTIYNINKCSIDDLKKISFIDEDMAFRIINYRKDFGNISAKSLQQLGLTPAQIAIVKQEVTGLAPDKSPNKKAGIFLKKKKLKVPLSNSSQIKKKQIIFQKLLASGFSAEMSLKISNIAVENSKNEIASQIKNFPGLSDNEKAKAIEICLEK